MVSGGLHAGLPGVGVDFLLDHVHAMNVSRLRRSPHPLKNSLRFSFAP